MTGQSAAWPRQLAEYIDACLAASAQIDAGRRQVLDGLARIVAAEWRRGGAVDLVFVCTHNSRRSQFGQVWAKVAAERFGLGGVRTWSGGTEATEFDRRAVAALVRAGLRVDAQDDGTNPAWLVRTHAQGEPIRCWSKLVTDPRNPQAGFIAVMTCAPADEACPTVPGAAHRIAVTYDNPKAHDRTARETGIYDARCRQAATEMLYVFREAAAGAAGRGIGAG